MADYTREIECKNMNSDEVAFKENYTWLNDACNKIFPNACVVVKIGFSIGKMQYSVDTYNEFLEEIFGHTDVKMSQFIYVASKKNEEVNCKNLFSFAWHNACNTAIITSNNKGNMTNILNELTIAIAKDSLPKTVTNENNGKASFSKPIIQGVIVWIIVTVTTLILSYFGFMI